jgi:hypothetical protein
LTSRDIDGTTKTGPVNAFSSGNHRWTTYRPRKSVSAFTKAARSTHHRQGHKMLMPLRRSKELLIFQERARRRDSRYA